MIKKIMITTMICLLLFSNVSAMSVSFYYSESCPHCAEIYPVVRELADVYPLYKFGLYDVSKDEDNHNAFLKYGFSGVPAFVIKTNDCREIIFVGADERRLKCELQEMTTLECPTYYDYHRDGSWFIN